MLESYGTDQSASRTNKNGSTYSVRVPKASHRRQIPSHRLSYLSWGLPILAWAGVSRSLVHLLTYLLINNRGKNQLYLECTFLISKMSRLVFDSGHLVGERQSPLLVLGALLHSLDMLTKPSYVLLNAAAWMSPHRWTIVPSALRVLGYACVASTQLPFIARRSWLYSLGWYVSRKKLSSNEEVWVDMWSGEVLLEARLLLYVLQWSEDVVLANQIAFVYSALSIIYYNSIYYPSSLRWLIRLDATKGNSQLKCW